MNFHFTKEFTEGHGDFLFRHRGDEILCFEAAYLIRSDLLGQSRFLRSTDLGLESQQ